MSAVCFRYTSPRCARVVILLGGGGPGLCHCARHGCAYVLALADVVVGDADIENVPALTGRGTGIIVADACAFHLSNSLVALSEEHCPSTYDGKVSHVPALCCLPSVGAVQCPDSGVPVVLE